MALDPELKKQWVAALRSGDYKQGRNYLCNEPGESARFCCFGVLADIKGVPFTRVAVTRYGADLLVRSYDFGGGASPNTLSITGDLRKMFGPEAVSYLEEQNDIGMTFKEIADYIEDHL